MNNIGGYQKTLRRIDIGFYLFIMILCGIVTEVCADSKKVAEPALSCKYFDSLSTDRNSCKSLNRGHKTEVKPEGEHKSLYRSAMKILASSEEGRKEIEASNGTISFEAWLVDLNGDGIEEAMVFTPAVLRGASGNGDIIVFQIQKEKKASQWRPIGFLLGHHVRIESIKSNRYYCLVTSWRMGGDSGVLTRYRMDPRAKKYIPSKEKEYACTLQSEEPCFRPR